MSAPIGPVVMVAATDVGRGPRFVDIPFAA
jgi:hypothetical protein